MSGSTPIVAGGSVLGGVAITQLPNTGPGDTIVQIAVFVAGVMIVWFVADLYNAKKRSK